MQLSRSVGNAGNGEPSESSTEATGTREEEESTTGEGEMKECLECGAMISPYPMHGKKYGICAECGGHDEEDHNRPKIKGKHMIIEKTPEQKAQEQRNKMLAPLRQHLRRY